MIPFADSNNVHLLKYSITDHKIIPFSARFGFGMMAGADRLGVHYDLIDSSNKTVLSWDDTQASTQGVAKCIDVINRNTIEKLRGYFSG